MSRIKGLALGLGVATVIVVGLACGAGEAPAPTEVGPASESPQAEGPSTIEPSTQPSLPSPSSQARETIPCFPTGLVARVGASVGDSWTLAGNIRLEGNIPGDPTELHDGPTESSVTFTLTGLDDGGRNWLVDEESGKRARIENSEASVHITTIYRDDEGNTLEATDRDEKWATFVIHGSDQALLTPDWDCHRNAWLTGGLPSSVSENVRLSGQRKCHLYCSR